MVDKAWVSRETCHRIASVRNTEARHASILREGGDIGISSAVAARRIQERHPQAVMHPTLGLRNC